MSREPVRLLRDVEVTVIPEGSKDTLREGALVLITQALGNSITVKTERGMMYRVEGEDADALGMEVEDQTQDEDAPIDEASVKERCWEALKQVHDPEIPINVVELGLIYELNLTPMEYEGRPGFQAHAVMTLTAPGCGMGDVFLEDVRRAMMSVHGVHVATAEISFDPVWNPYTMMSEGARLQLGML